MYHGRKPKNYKVFVWGKWVSNDGAFRFGFMTRKSAENWATRNNLDRFAQYWQIEEKEPAKEAGTNGKE